MSLRPELIHNYETAVHDAFLRTLAFCYNTSKSYESSDFTHCIKAGGVNFNYTYEQFERYKTQAQQTRLAGLKD
jgi:hypothetical protein